jgi:Ni/Co efflux regulator RcnB
MKRPMKHLIVAAAALSALVGSVAMADSHGRDKGHDNSRHDDRRGHEEHRYDDQRVQDQHHWNNDHRDYRAANNSHWDNRSDYRYVRTPDWNRYDHRYDYHPPARYRVVNYYPPHGYRPYAWYRGSYLPATYYAPRYVVYNYYDYRLNAPPYGYHWVRVNNDVVLAAITTGLVMQVVNGLFY